MITVQTTFTEASIYQDKVEDTGAEENWAIKERGRRREGGRRGREEGGRRRRGGEARGREEK